MGPTFVAQASTNHHVVIQTIFLGGEDNVLRDHPTKFVYIHEGVLSGRTAAWSHSIPLFMVTALQH